MLINVFMNFNYLIRFYDDGLNFLSKKNDDGLNCFQEEIFGWRDDLFIVRKSVVNLFGVFLMLKVSINVFC